MFSLLLIDAYSQYSCYVSKDKVRPLNQYAEKLWVFLSTFPVTALPSPTRWHFVQRQPENGTHPRARRPSVPLVLGPLGNIWFCVS